jgi:Cytochrome c7 and related cytochrome c/Class III cytochrome C family
MRQRVLVGVGALIMVAGALVVFSQKSGAQQPGPTAPTVAAIDTSSLKGPRQPIFFRHDIHAGQKQIACQYCHYTAGVSNEPGVPSMQTCMGCHQLMVSGSTPENKAEIKKLTTAWKEKKPVEWVRVHSVARHVHFPHSQHIKALGPQACATCHGNISRMPQVYKVNNVNNMGFCISCHLERKVSRDCTVCHY